MNFIRLIIVGYFIINSILSIAVNMLHILDPDAVNDICKKYAEDYNLTVSKATICLYSEMMFLGTVALIYVIRDRYFKPQK